MNDVRIFFQKRHVLEVETPLLCQGIGTDPCLEPLSLKVQDQQRYLQTSPEFAMKRLLASGSGDIMQISKAFRKDEQGARHNPEFTLLEWYRVGWELPALMEETDALLRVLLHTPPAQIMTYATAFQQHLLCNPHEITAEQAVVLARCHGLPTHWSLQALRDALFASCVEPHLGMEAPLMLTHFPSDSAALAQKDPITQHALRFEVFYQGWELGNGYCELQDPQEWLTRCAQDNTQRVAEGLPVLPGDPYLHAAMRSGLPACSGIAMGLDRVFALQQGHADLTAVLAFPWDRA